MKMYKNIIAATLAAFFAIACDNDGYIDPITPVDAGPDESAPTVVISDPNTSKVIIPFTETDTDLDIQFEVNDDVEIASITLSLDGAAVETYDSFLDYRRSVRTFRYENLPVGQHTVEVTATDASGKSTTKSFVFEISNIYEAKYEGEMFYMPFEADAYLDLISKTSATVVGDPGFATGKIGKAYAGQTDAYLTFPTDGLLTPEFSAAFWYKLNASPDRAGILTVSPPDLAKPLTPNNRTSGFRLFREDAGGKQRIKLNVGNGTGDNWFDGGAAADIDPAANQWVHIAFTIAADRAVVYLNGEIVSQGTFPGVDWTGCDLLSIASGAPRFTEWNHLSDLSLIDELRFFSKALTQEQVKAVMAD
jgi:hypothetical protein